MKTDELKNLSNEELLKKEKGTKTLMGLFVPIILALLYFGFRDYFSGEKTDFPITIITVCSIGGMVSLIPEVKRIQEELERRKG